MAVDKPLNGGPARPSLTGGAEDSCLNRRDRVQLLPRRLAEILQRIDALAALHNLAQVGDRPIRREISLDDRVHDLFRAPDRSRHGEHAHPTDHGVEIDDLRHLGFTVDQASPYILDATTMKSRIRSSRRARSCATLP